MHDDLFCVLSLSLCSLMHYIDLAIMYLGHCTDASWGANNWRLTTTVVTVIIIIAMVVVTNCWQSANADICYS